DQHAPVEPAEHLQAAVEAPDLIDRRREHRMQQIRRGRIEHVADVIVTGDFGEAEQAGGVGVPMASLELALMRQEDGLCRKNTENAAMPMSPIG
ncbi:MAG: hypothetical protein ACJ8AW_53395, partial [Rhodopila sp.]